MLNKFKKVIFKLKKIVLIFHGISKQLINIKEAKKKRTHTI